MKNSYRTWTEDDIETLHMLLREGVSCQTASKILGRTPKAISHAVKNSIYQQLLSHHPDDVAQYYNTTNDTLETLVPKKYYKEVDGSDSERSDDEVIVSSLGCYKPGNSSLALPVATMAILGSITYYIWILRDQWMSLA